MKFGYYHAVCVLVQTASFCTHAVFVFVGLIGSDGVIYFIQLVCMFMCLCLFVCVDACVYMHACMCMHICSCISMTLKQCSADRSFSRLVCFGHLLHFVVFLSFHDYGTEVYKVI